MNINENYNYNQIQLPSEIMDSFEHSSLEPSSQSSAHPPHISHLLHYYPSSQPQPDQPSSQPLHYQPQSQANIDTSFEDTFLANLPVLLTRAQPHPPQPQPEPALTISKAKIIRHVLPKQQVLEYVQVVNACEWPIALTIHVPAQVQLLYGQAYEVLAEGGLPGVAVRECYLEPWEKVEMGLSISKGEEEIGDVFETVSMEYRIRGETRGNRSTLVRKKRAYIEIEVHYITPRMRVRYEGCSDVATISLNKVSLNKIARNKAGEHCLHLEMAGVERFECTVEARGNLRLFPGELILYKNETKKIVFKAGSQRGALVLRAKDCPVVFVMGVELI